MRLDRFYVGKRVIVTGHTGFKGSWLCAWLKRMGASVTGISLAPDPGRPNHFELAGIEEGMTSIIHDIRDGGGVIRAFAQHEPEIVFHLAAQALVRRSYRDPVTTYGTNVMGSVHVLEACRQCASVRSVVNVTSDKCYENQEWEWGYRERDRMGGRDPYSSSKSCAELATTAYLRSFFENSGCGLSSARAGNVVGGGDWSEDRLIPDIVTGFTARCPVIIRNPTAVRPWQHVLEPLFGYLALAMALHEDPARFAGPWNFGPLPGDSMTVLEVAELAAELWGDGRFACQAEKEAPHEAKSLRLDCTKALNHLPWQPLLSTREALTMAINWYKMYYACTDTPAAITQRQIDAYHETVMQSFDACAENRISCR